MTFLFVFKLILEILVPFNLHMTNVYFAREVGGYMDTPLSFVSTRPGWVLCCCNLVSPILLCRAAGIGKPDKVPGLPLFDSHITSYFICKIHIGHVKRSEISRIIFKTELWQIILTLSNFFFLNLKCQIMKTLPKVIEANWVLRCLFYVPVL